MKAYPTSLLTPVVRQLLEAVSSGYIKFRFAPGILLQYLYYTFLQCVGAVNLNINFRLNHCQKNRYRSVIA